MKNTKKRIREIESRKYNSERLWLQPLGIIAEYGKMIVFGSTEKNIRTEYKYIQSVLMEPIEAYLKKEWDNLILSGDPVMRDLQKNMEMVEKDVKCVLSIIKNEKELLVEEISNSLEYVRTLFDVLIEFEGLNTALQIGGHPKRKDILQLLKKNPLRELEDLIDQTSYWSLINFNDLRREIIKELNIDENMYDVQRSFPWLYQGIDLGSWFYTETKNWLRNCMENKQFLELPKCLLLYEDILVNKRTGKLTVLSENLNIILAIETMKNIINDIINGFEDEILKTDISFWISEKEKKELINKTINSFKKKGDRKILKMLISHNLSSSLFDDEITYEKLIEFFVEEGVRIGLPNIKNNFGDIEIIIRNYFNGLILPYEAGKSIGKKFRLKFEKKFSNNK